MAAKSCKCDCGKSSKKLADLEKRIAKLEKNDNDLQGRFKRMKTLTQQMASSFGQMWAALLRGNLPQFWRRYRQWTGIQLKWMAELVGIGTGGDGGGGDAKAMDLSKLEKRLEDVYRKANEAAYAAKRASEKIDETRRLANDAAAGIRSVSNKVTGAERKILATLATMSIAIAGVAGAAAVAVSKAFALTFAGLSGLVQAAIAQLKILTAGFDGMQASLNAIQNLIGQISNLINRVEKAVDSVLNMLNRTQLEVNFISKMVENIYGYIQYLDKKFTGYTTDLRADNTRAYNLINGTRTLLESRIQGVIDLLRIRVSGNIRLPTASGGVFNLPFVGEGFDGVKSGIEQLGNGLSRVLQRAYQQKLIDVIKFNAQIAQKDQDGNWQNITKEITSLRVGSDGLQIFDSQVLVDLQELKKRETEAPVLALADLHGLRPGGDRPVLVIAYRQRLADKWGRSTYALSLFHPSASALEYLFSDGAVIDPRTVGKDYAFLVLKDGTRLTVMSPSVASSRQYLEYLLQWVDNSVIPSQHDRLIVTGEGYDHGSQIQVVARKIEYYPNGQRANISPERFKYFN